MPDRRPAQGKTIEIVGGEADGDTFFVGDVVIRASAFDGVVSRPMRLGDDEKDHVFVYLTFIGEDNDTLEPRAVTIVMRNDMLPAIGKGARQLYASIPIQFREERSDNSPTSTDVPEIPGTVAEG